MNPYSVVEKDAPTQVDEAALRKARQAAVKLASGGAVVGSISKKIQCMGLDTSTAEAVATDAVIARLRVERLQGIGIIVFGMSIAFGGYLLSFVFTLRIPFVVAITGAFFVMLGCARAFQRSKLHRPGRF